MVYQFDSNSMARCFIKLHGIFQKSRTFQCVFCIHYYIVIVFGLVCFVLFCFFMNSMEEFGKNRSNNQHFCCCCCCCEIQVQTCIKIDILMCNFCENFICEKKTTCENKLINKMMIIMRKSPYDTNNKMTIIIGWQCW